MSNALPNINHMALFIDACKLLLAIKNIGPCGGYFDIAVPYCTKTKYEWQKLPNQATTALRHDKQKGKKTRLSNAKASQVLKGS